MIEDDTGFVLHARAYRETSLLVEVLSAQHGRIGLLARGVSTAKGQVLRAALQPLQWIRFSAQQRGELAQLRGAEALDAAPRLVGQAMLAGFYLSELTLRLAPRQDPLPELYLAYGEARARLAIGAGLAWTLRRYERELLAALGLALRWTVPATASPSTRRRATNWTRRRGAAPAERAWRGAPGGGHWLGAAGPGGRRRAGCRRSGQPAPADAAGPGPSPGRARVEVLGNARAACAPQVGGFGRACSPAPAEAESTATSTAKAGCPWVGGVGPVEGRCKYVHVSSVAASMRLTPSTGPTRLRQFLASCWTCRRVGSVFRRKTDPTPD